MTKPPAKNIQKDYVQSAVRFPPKLRDELREAAARNDRSFNAEVLARLQSDDRLAVALAELAEIKGMLRKVLDQI